MSTNKIKKFLLEEIETIEKKCNKLIGEINLLKVSLELHEESINNKVDKDYPVKTIEAQAKKMHSIEEKIELTKKFLEVEISKLASKKANLHWIDDGNEYE